MRRLGIGIIGLYCYVNRGSTDERFSRNFIILTVIFSSLFLIVAGYTERQTAPVFALLGTIIGYLFGVLGKSQEVKLDRQEEGKPDQHGDKTATETTQQGSTASSTTGRSSKAN